MSNLSDRIRNLSLEAAAGPSWSLRSAIDILAREVERLESTSLSADKPFPMQDGPAIPWSLAERIYEVYTDVCGQDQTLERLAERGGFGWAEIPILRRDYFRKHSRFPDWDERTEPIARRKP